MGSDKRKARRAGAHARRTARRAPYAKVLIVCEGSKTEPQYFNELKDQYRINTANVVVTGESGSDPLSIWRFAHGRYLQERRLGDPFDRVFCVFDKDTHDTYDEALAQIKRARPAGTFHAITSVPCFEYWLLLHFTPTRQPFAPLRGNSPANQVLRELKCYMPGYHKAHKGLFIDLQGQLPQAMAHARRLLAQAERDGSDNPSTRIHELVAFLQEIKNHR